MKDTSKDTSYENKIAKLLNRGVILCAILLFLGWLFGAGSLKTLFQWDSNPLEPFQNYKETLSLSQSLRPFFRGHNYGILLSYLGLGFLILLPVLRILTTTILFIKQRDFQMASIGGLVFLLILISFALGI